MNSWEQWKNISIYVIYNVVDMMKSVGRLLIGDIGRLIDWQAERSQRLDFLNAYEVAKHKTSRQEGCSLTFMTDWLMTSSRWRPELDNMKEVEKGGQSHIKFY